MDSDGGKEVTMDPYATMDPSEWGFEEAWDCRGANHDDAGGAYAWWDDPASPPYDPDLYPNE